MENLFDIEKFNVIEDEENYYFFRSLEPGDIEDISNGVINGENGYTKLRTDRERWEEQHPGEKPAYNKDSKVSLEQMYSHIKIHYSLQTNCISLSSNANVARTYGEAFSDKYVMIKVQKQEMGEKVFHAGQYMLDEIEKRVSETIATSNIPNDIVEDFKKIDNAKNSDEIKEIIKTRYKIKKPLDASKAKVKGGIKYKSPHARISSYQALNDEQILEKNKVVAKLTILENKKIMKPIISRSLNNNSLIQTMGSAFSSSEQIYYGDIEGERTQDISKEVLDIFGLLQQIEGQPQEIVSELKREVINFVNSGKKIEIPQDSILYRDDKLKDNITIEEMYELTKGKVEYGQANSIVKNMFYLAKAQSNARELADILNEITGNSPKYQETIQYIANNGFEIEPKVTTRLSNKGVRISESVNLNLKKNEIDLVEKIKNLTKEEQIEILENGGLSNVQNIMSSTFSNIEDKKLISKEDYYARAIIDSYNWEDIGIEEFTLGQRNELIQKLKEKDCVNLYQKLKEAGIQEKNISAAVLNIASRSNLNEIANKENFAELIHENINEL